MSEKMPVLFVAHGHPMNAIKVNEFAEAWVEVGQNPKASLAVSIDWVTDRFALAAFYAIRPGKNT